MEQRYSSTHSQPLQQMEASGHLHVLATLPPGKLVPIHTEVEATGVPESVWTFQAIYRYLAPTRNQDGTGKLSQCSDSLWAEPARDRISVGARFSTPIQTGPGAYPAAYSMGTWPFPGVKWAGYGIDHPPPSRAKVEGRVVLYIYTPSGPSWPVRGWTLPLPLPGIKPQIVQRMAWAL